MKKIKIDVVAVPLSGHLYPTLNLVKPLLDDPSMEIRVFTGPQKKAVAESLGFTVVPILEDKVEEFERAANNDKKLNLFSAYRQLSKSLDLINHVSDQLLEEWRVNRPDIVIADFITLSAGFVAEELEFLGLPPWRHNLRSKLLMVLLASSEGWESRAQRRKRRYKHYAVNSRALENTVGLSSYANA